MTEDAIVASADALAAVFNRWVVALCERRGLDVAWTMPEPFHAGARSEIDLAREGIGSVVWTTGFRPAYSWVHVDVFDEMGFPRQVGFPASTSWACTSSGSSSPRSSTV